MSLTNIPVPLLTPDCRKLYESILSRTHLFLECNAGKVTGTFMVNGNYVGFWIVRNLH
jgi:hypothetical protein